MVYLMLLFCGIIVCASARPKEQEVYRLPPETVLKAQKFSIPCIEETHADPDILRKLLDGTMANDESSKNFVYCFSVRGKFTDEAGHFNIERMLGLLDNHRQSKPFAETLAECNKITKETPEETAYEMSFCLNNNAPVKFSL